MITRDTSCRPHEILKLKIKDIVFKTSGDNQYAEVLVIGKTGSRNIPLINSIPYVKDWLDEHPQNGNPNAALICGFGRSLGRRLQPITLNKIYTNYKMAFFPKLLQDHNIPEEDKQKIKELLKKPWNPYIRRHSALTEKSTMLKEQQILPPDWNICTRHAKNSIYRRRSSHVRSCKWTTNFCSRLFRRMFPHE
jgi:hypothetical protein